MAEEEKLNFKKIFPVFIIILIDLLGLTIIIPLLPLYAASFGASASVIGVLGAAYPVAQFVGAPILGRLSDRFGRKPVLLFSQLGTMAGFLLLGWAHTLTLLFISRIVDGLSGANISTAQAVISDITTEKTRTQGLGLLGAAFGLGFVIGPVIAFVSLAVSGNNFHVPAFIAAGLSGLSVLLTAFWLEESLPPERRAQSSHKREFSFKGLLEAFTRPLVGFLLVLMFLQQIAFGGFEQLLSLFTLSRLGMNASGNAIIFVFVGVIVVAVQGYFIGKWSRRFGEPWLIRLGLLALAAGLILTALTPRQPLPGYSRAGLEQQLTSSSQLPGQTPPTENLSIPLPDESNRGWLGLGWILAAMIPAAVGGGLLQPAINSMLTRSVPTDQIGGTLGLSASLLSGANAIAPLAGGFLFQALGPSWPFILGGILLAILGAAAFRAVRPLPAAGVG